MDLLFEGGVSAPTAPPGYGPVPAPVNETVSAAEVHDDHKNWEEILEFASFP